ncbi:MAG: hypothetical protein OXH38_09885 [Chloroflexi bacterium]|nr:hypothetical protein [Chloroflexota bacterium]
MPHHQALLDDPVATLRRVWDDTGWRFVLIASLLTFLLETLGELTNVDQGSIWWAAELVTIVVIARALTMRPLRGNLSDTENMTVALATLGLLICEVILSWSTVAATFAQEPIFWPFSLMLILTIVAARVLAPYASRPLFVWALVFSFLQFWLNAAIWYSGADFPSPVFTWALALTGFAFFARWIAGRGIDGPIVSPLNVALVLFVIMDWWLEYGISESGVGAEWLAEDLYWPWILINGGLAATAALAAPRVSVWLKRDLS